MDTGKTKGFRSKAKINSTSRALRFNPDLYPYESIDSSCLSSPVGSLVGRSVWRLRLSLSIIIVFICTVIVRKSFDI